MRVLIDERAARALKRYLTTFGHECLTVQEVGWTGKQNGELLSLAEASFDRMLTLGTSLSCQQNLTGRKIAIVVLHSSSNRLDHPTSTLSRLHLSHRESQTGRDRSSRQFQPFINLELLKIQRNEGLRAALGRLLLHNVVG